MENRLVLNRARQAGRVSYKAGRRITESPFLPGTAVHEEWLTGYREAKALVDGAVKKARRQRKAAGKTTAARPRRKPAAKKAGKKAEAASKAQAPAPDQAEDAAGINAPAPPAGESRHRAVVGDEA
jgi:ribosome modulation factor